MFVCEEQDRRGGIERERESVCVLCHWLLAQLKEHIPNHIPFICEGLAPRALHQIFPIPTNHNLPYSGPRTYATHYSVRYFTRAACTRGLDSVLLIAIPKSPSKEEERPNRTRHRSLPFAYAGDGNLNPHPLLPHLSAL